MNKLHSLYFRLSIFMSLFLPIIIPNEPVEEGILEYHYGFPFNYITIYQEEPRSDWFFNNFFSGNAGLLINPASMVINAIVIYFILIYTDKLIKKLNKKVMSCK